MTLGAILPQQLKCSMPSCVSLDLSSSIFPLTEDLKTLPSLLSISPLPLTSLGLASFLPIVTLSSSVCTMLLDYSIVVIVAKMTNFLIVLLQIFISIFLKSLIFFFSPPSEFCAIAFFRLKQLLVSALQGGRVLLV